MDVEKYMAALGAAAREASREIASSSTAARNRALLAARDALDGDRASLAEANARDLEQGLLDFRICIRPFQFVLE